MRSPNYPSNNLVKQVGFGLLEALIALVLLSSVGLTILAWANQNIDTAQRLRAHYEKQDARRKVLEWGRVINPMEKPDGMAGLGKLRVVWKTRSISDVVQQVGYPLGQGMYQIGLYEIEMTVFESSEIKPWFVEKFNVVGHKKNLVNINPFFGK